MALHFLKEEEEEEEKKNLISEYERFPVNTLKYNLKVNFCVIKFI